MDKAKLDNSFNELIKQAKLTGRNEYSPDEWAELYKHASKPKIPVGIDWFYYIIIIVVVLIIIFMLLVMYYSIKPDIKTIDAMNDNKNKSYGFPVEFDDTEYDENGEEVIFVD